MPRLRVPEAHLFDVLRLVHRNGQVSRSALSAATGHSVFLTSTICERLLETGFIVEAGTGVSTGGRRPKLLTVRPGLGRLIGIDLGTVHARVALTDADGNLLDFEKASSHVAAGPEVALPQAIQVVERVLRRQRVAREDLWGIGMGISGVVDRPNGVTLLWPKAPRWVDVHARRVIADHFQTTVDIDDSARTMAMAERRFGIASAVAHFIYLMLGAGTGSALVLNGDLYTGSAGFAGEFGHVTVEENGPPCSCGNRGCLEALASASALIARSRAAMEAGLNGRLWSLCHGDPGHLTAELIAQAAREGDRFSTNLLNEAGAHIGLAVVSLVNLLNPELIVIGGGLASAASEFLLPAVQRAVRERAVERAADVLRIQLSTTTEADWARGAAMLVAESCLETHLLQAVKAAAPRKRRAAVPTR